MPTDERPLKDDEVIAGNCYTRSSSTSLVYIITSFCSIKDRTTGEWIDGVAYIRYGVPDKLHVREAEDFKQNFRIHLKN